MIGQTLGQYEITAAIGAGGMGEVFRARDSKLARDVAIKVLPAELAQDRERLARFEREAKLLASLNHSNIAHVYGFEAAALPDGSLAHFLAMELVEGADLGERLKRGAIPVEEAVAIAKQIAEGLDEAHANGIIHRDLKPANVKVTPEGRVKILDFGLAKALQEDPSRSAADSHLSHSPTLLRHATEAGVILGTAAYMSPEQARGKAVDKRADIWAFGVVLFEMLTGESLFAGETVSDTLAGVLTREPPWDRLPADVSPDQRATLRRCLERDPRRRLRDIGDVALGRDSDTAPLRLQTWRHSLVVGIAAAAFGALAVLLALGNATTAAVKVVRSSLVLPADRPFLINNATPTRALSISSDGSTIAYVGADPGAVDGRRLYVRSLDALEPRPVAGTEGAHGPFLSPDGEWAAFFTASEGALRKAPLAGGSPLTLTRGVKGAAWTIGIWSEAGIVFHDWPRGLRVVPEAGGDGRLLASPDNEVYFEPQPVPGTGALLYTVQSDAGFRLETSSFEGERRRTVLEKAAYATPLSSGHLLFSRDGELLVAPFDAAEQRVTGPPSPLPFRVMVDSRNTAEPVPQLAVSSNGTLAYVPASGALDRECRLSWIGPSGAAEPIGTLAAGTPDLQISPDGTRIAISRRMGAVVRYEVVRLSSMTSTLVADVKANLIANPVWHPDGRHIVVLKEPKLKTAELWLYAVEGDSAPERLAEVPGMEVSPHSFSPDGRLLTVTAYAHDTGADILIVDLGDKDRPASVTPFARTEANESRAYLSPDGRFIAYSSDESGKLEVYIRRFPGGEGLTRISLDGGVNARWSPRGDEVYFVSDGGVLASRIDNARGLRADAPRTVFEGSAFIGLDYGAGFDVAPDGRILVRALPEDPRRRHEIVVVQNWFQELRQLTGVN